MAGRAVDPSKDKRACSLVSANDGTAGELWGGSDRAK